MNAPALNSLFNVPTPYQGKKRCFGEYVCSKCNKSWKSANSKANEWQKCNNCSNQVYPSRQNSTENYFRQLKAAKENKISQFKELAECKESKGQTKTSTPHKVNKPLTASIPFRACVPSNSIFCVSSSSRPITVSNNMSTSTNMALYAYANPTWPVWSQMTAANYNNLFGQQ